MKIAILAVEGRSTNIVFQALVREFRDVTLVIERPVAKSQLIKRRLKRLGPAAVTGQILFMLLDRMLRKSAEARIGAILEEQHLDDSPARGDVRHIASVNSQEAADLLQSIQPDLVVVNGTRIVGQDTLSCIDAPFLNMHAGITPRYRGVHGGYWAIAEGHPELAGTTVHFVDKGIDTGKVIKQAIISVNRADNFATYPYLQLGAGVPMLIQSIKEIESGTLSTSQIESSLPSRLYYHPTLWGYVFRRLFRGIR